MVWREVQIQTEVGGAENQKPATQGDGKGECHGGLWGAILMHSSHLCGFAARLLVVGHELPLVTRDRLADQHSGGQ